jgi:hypothetical protein
MVTDYPTFLLMKGLISVFGPLAQARPTLPPPPDGDETGVEDGLELLELLECFVEVWSLLPSPLPSPLPLLEDLLDDLWVGEGWADDGLCLHRLESLEVARFLFAMAPCPRAGVSRI